jgi:hypothetical protein
MTIDLSAPSLRPDAVLDLVRRHTDPRPERNILFKVSRETFDLHRRELTNVVPVSAEEAETINRELGLDGEPTDYLVSGGEWRCTGCRRHLNFFDVYQSGKKQHDNDFFRLFLDGDAHHMQVARASSRLEVTCTACGTMNEMLTVTHYSGSVGGSAYTYA